MIPKKIHYCWFGGKELPEDAKKCIASWKKHCPDYEIIEWNETNYDLNKNEYVREAYKSKKWAFLTDYIRLDIIYNEGGIYLDTDVELLKPLDDLLDNEIYLGMEQVGTVNTGQGFGAKKGNKFVKENKEYYEKNKCVDKDGNFIKTICVKITTELLEKYGLKKENEIQVLKNDIKILPTDYFCPLIMGTNKLKITKNTYSIHHFEGSWKSENKIIRKLDYYTILPKQEIKKFLNIKDKKPTIKSLIINDDKKYLENMFVLFILINTIFKGLGFENDSLLYLIGMAISFIPLLIKIINTQYTKKEKYFIIFSLIIGFGSIISTEKPTLLVTILGIIGVKNVDINKLLKNMLNVRVTTFTITISLAILGIISKGEMVMWRNGVMDVRTSLGYSHPNILHLSLFIIIALYIMCYYDKIKLKNYALLLLINVLFYGFSVSRTGFAVTSFLIIISYLSTLQRKKLNIIIKKSPKYLFLFLLFMSIITGIFYSSSSIIQNLNVILNGRIAYSSFYLNNYDLSLFGSTLKKGAILDNSYILFVVQYGILGLLYIMGMYVNLYKNIEKNKNISVSMVLLSIFVYIFTESFAINIFMNFLLLYVTMPFSHEKEQNIALGRKYE